MSIDSGLLFWAILYFLSCYNKCVKRFFAFARYSSLNWALLQTGLPSCTTVIYTTFNFALVLYDIDFHECNS